MRFEAMINNATMKSKEQCRKWTGAIKNNRAKSYKSAVKTVNESELATAIVAGHTIIPAILDEKQKLDKEYYKHQQLFGLDFDNKNPFNDSEQADELYYMTYNRIMSICKKYHICPVVVYETFSSKPEWKKYRAMFVTEEPIEDKAYRKLFLTALMKLFAVNGIYTTDSKCVDEGRIFYAGHTVIVVNTDVPVSPAAVIKATEGIEVHEAVKKSSKSKKSSCSTVASNEMIEAIMNRDIESYTELLSKAVSEAANADTDWVGGILSNYHTIKFMNIHKDYCPEITQQALKSTETRLCGDVFELTSYLPLNIMLGLPFSTAFSCILPQHDDETPSASIKQLDDGRYVYNCWGCIGDGRYYDVIDVFSILMASDVWEAVKFILSATGLEIETEWQKEQREVIDGNLDYIDSEYFKRRHSILYNELVSAKAWGQLKFFLRYARGHLTPESLTQDGRPTFFLSNRKASELMKVDGYKGISKDCISKKLIYLCKLGFFDKVTKAEIPATVLQRATETAQKNAAESNAYYKYRQDFLYIPEYNTDMFMDAEAFIIDNKSIGVRRSCQSREQSLRAYGKEATDSLYTQDTHRDHSKKSVKFYSRYVELARLLIASNGFTSEAEILKHIKGYGSEEKKKLSGQCLPQLIMENGYQRIRVNKESRAIYSIPDKYKSGSCIIVCNESVQQAI